jgi:hypothetical protein
MAVATVVVGSMAVGCSMEGENETTSAESANTGGINESTREAALVVRAANETPLQTLIDEAHLSKLAALAIDAYRKGDDEIEGTEDDEQFESLAELDAIPHVGPNELHALLAFARRKPAAIISGRVLEPPALSIYAFKTDGSKYYKQQGPFNRRSYALAVDPGEYYVVAYSGPLWTAAFTNAEHFLASVTVAAGEEAHVDPDDLLVRWVPVEPTSPLRFGCRHWDVGICGTTAVFQPPTPDRDMVTWCDGHIRFQQICDYSEKCAWESDSRRFSCVPR